jgi:hypothetical protein
VLDTLSTPLLLPTAVVTKMSHAVTIETGDSIYTVDDADPDIVSQILKRSSGAMTVEGIAGALRRRPDDIACVLAPLADDGLVIDLSSIGRSSHASDLLASIAKETRFWARLVAETEFWKALMSGRASRDVVLGWGIEFTHYVDSADKYMPLGIAYCRLGPQAREVLSRHYASETRHAEIFRSGLASCGISAAASRRAPPLPSTLALTNHLCELAIRGGLGYISIFSLMQATPSRADDRDIRTFWSALKGLYTSATELFNAFERHAMLDLREGHQTPVLDRLLRDCPKLEPRDLGEIASSIRETAALFRLFFDGVLTYYSSRIHQCPRRPFELAALPELRR